MKYVFGALFILFGISYITHAQVNVTNVAVSANVVLVWEAETYVPPFYKGKALLPDGADVRIMAFPPANLGDASALSYTWKVDGEVIDTASGVGRSFFIQRSDVFGGSKLIVVEVSRGGTKVGTGVARVPLVKPSVALFSSLPLTGILFGGGLDAPQGDEVTLEAYPLFFSVDTKSNPNLTYDWSINGEHVSNPLGNSGRLTLRKDAGGAAHVGLSLQNEVRVLETTSGSIDIVFEE